MSKVYRVEFELSSPIACDMPILLDALLARQYLLKKGLLGQVREVVMEDIYDFANDPEFPLEVSPKGYFLASYLFYDQETLFEDQKGFRKAFQVRKAYLLSDKEASRQIDIQRGQFRAVNDALTLKYCSKVTGWFCGDLEGTHELLSTVTNLGKKASIGMGEVVGFKIFDEHEISFDTHHLRPLPMKEAYEERKLAGRLLMLRKTPPYHQKADAEPCMVPSQFIY